MKKLIRFNVQNIKYAVEKEDGTYSAPIEYGAGSAKKMALESSTANKVIYGDGKILVDYVKDNGKTGTMTTNNISTEYEIAMGRKVQGINGIIDVGNTKQQKHAIYFEIIELTENGDELLAKVWVYGVTSKRPNESYDQNTDNINESSFDTALTVRGTNLLKEDNKPYINENGIELYAYQQLSEPGDTGFETFGNQVALPIIKSKISGL